MDTPCRKSTDMNSNYYSKCLKNGQPFCQISIKSDKIFSVKWELESEAAQTSNLRSHKYYTNVML